MSALDKWKKLSKVDERWLQSVKVDGKDILLDDALKQADEHGLDLMLVNKFPPVAKIVNYGKLLYEQKKAMKENKKKQQTQKTKEIKFHVCVDDADYNHKLKQIEEFIAEGDRVDVKVVLRGREARQSGTFVDDFVKKLVEDLSKLGTTLKNMTRNGNIFMTTLVGGKK